VFSVPWLK